MKDIRQGAPAAVAGQHGLLGFARPPAFVLDKSQGADGGDVVAGLFLKTALPDPVGFGYPEVARRRPRLRFRLDIADVDFPGFYFTDLDVMDGGVSAVGLSSPGSAHSCTASSHAAW